MTAKNKRAMVIANMIGMLFNMYEKHERTKYLELLKIKLRKGLRKQFKINIDSGKKDQVEEVLEAGNKVWQEAIDEFNLTYLEASAFVLGLSLIDPNTLAKKYNISQGALAAWAKPSKSDNARELEYNTSKVVKFIENRLNDMFGIEEKKLSFKERLALHTASNTVAS